MYQSQERVLQTSLVLDFDTLASIRWATQPKALLNRRTRYNILTTGQFYGCANLLASWAGKDAVCAADLGSEATATSCGIRDLCV